MNNITSLWDAPRNKITDKHIYYMMNSRLCHCIVNEMVGRYVDEDYDPILYNELKNVAYYGFWEAIKKFDPKKGKFTTYATYKCQSYITAYVRDNAPDKKIKYIDINTEDEIITKELSDDTFESNIHEKIYVDEILHKLKPYDKNRLIKFFLKDKKKHGNSNYYYHIKNINSSLQRARQII